MAVAEIPFYGRTRADAHPHDDLSSALHRSAATFATVHLKNHMPELLHSRAIRTNVKISTTVSLLPGDAGADIEQKRLRLPNARQRGLFERPSAESDRVIG